ncbi:MAG: hypothetical protein ABGZ53_12400 [Fuerstiella sp.]
MFDKPLCSSFCERGTPDVGWRAVRELGELLCDAAPLPLEQEHSTVSSGGNAHAQGTGVERTVSQHNELLAALNRDLEAARYATDRAQRQYDGVDPENRLVADELEHRWNEALSELQSLENRVAREKSNQAVEPPPSLEEFMSVADHFRVVWHDPQTSMRLKKRILRTLIREIIVDTDSNVGEIVVRVHWNGGVHTTGSVKRRRRGQNSLHTSSDVSGSGHRVDSQS